MGLRLGTPTESRMLVVVGLTLDANWVCMYQLFQKG